MQKRWLVSVASPMAPPTTALTAPLPSDPLTRLERKTFVNPRRVDYLLAWLSHACTPAPDYPEGQVTSCYYDTRDLDEYFKSFDGDLEKHKVRLRWYGTPPTSGEVTAYLELKSKRGAETTKHRTPLTISADLLAAGEFAALLPSDQMSRMLLAFGYQRPYDLRPSAVVTYHRYRFVEPHSQVGLSVDTNITAWMTGEHRSWPAVHIDAAVLELKGGGLELAPRLHQLRRFRFVWTAFSKYAAAIEALAESPGPLQP